MLNKNEVVKNLNDLTVHPVPVIVNNKTVENYKAICMDNTNQVVQIVSDRYKIFQHIEAFDRTVEELDELGVNWEINNLKINNERGRNAINITFNLPDLTFDIDGSDTIATYEMFNSTDTSCAFTRLFGAFRLICKNGLVIGKKFFGSKRKHSGRFELGEPKDTMYNLNENIDELQMVLKQAQNKKITDDFLKTVASLGFPKRILDNLPEVFVNYATLNQERINDYTSVWALYAVLTNYLSNVVAKTNLRRYMDMQRTLYNTVQRHVRG